jgi:transcription-repair coupling factor (superfamily II helicase)
VPEQVRLLSEFALLRAVAQKCGVESIDRRQGYFNVKIHENARINAESLMHLVQDTPGCQFTPAGVLRLPADDWPVSKPGPMLGYLQQVLERLLR